ncbi:glycoside hydrolase [Xylaria arbuscula]|nr:glycoside hydrolase [Xylaria arbuscula]
MPAPLFLILLVAVWPLVQCHTTFVHIAHNGEWQEPLRYIRNKTAPYDDIGHSPDNPTSFRGYNFPTYPNDRPESIRCGRGHMTHTPDTDVLTLRAGDTLEFAHQRYEPFEWKPEHFINCPEGRGTCDSPTVPEGQDIHSYDGSGEWVKIYTLGVERREPNNPKNPYLWLPHNDGNLPPRFAFKIPPQTPSGQYLLRIDMIWPGTVIGDYRISAQMYPSCAQIEVDGTTTSGILPQGIRIPEEMSDTSPGMSQSQAMHEAKTVDTDWVYPGGLLWNGERLIEDRPVL